MRKPSLPEEDFLYELKDVLSDAVENRRWPAAEEALEMILEQLGEDPISSMDDDGDEY
jgi:hypothetical protein